jgi:hypothetical protein
VKDARRGGKLGAAAALWALSVAPACAASPVVERSVPERSSRSVLLPQRFGWVTSAGQSGALPSAISLGGKASGDVLVYLEFAAPEGGRKLLRAELWLSLTRRPAQPVDVELSRSDEAGEKLSAWSDRPAARYPLVSAELGRADARSLLDVSELVRAPAKAGEPLRVLLRAEPDAEEAALLETGAFGGRAPRLELYWD